MYSEYSFKTILLTTICLPHEVDIYLRDVYDLH